MMHVYVFAIGIDVFHLVYQIINHGMDIITHEDASHVYVFFIYLLSALFMYPHSSVDQPLSSKMARATPVLMPQRLPCMPTAEVNNHSIVAL